MASTLALQALLLGVACTVVYLRSGSLWLAAATHAVPVWVWLNCCGGIQAFEAARLPPRTVEMRG